MKKIILALMVFSGLSAFSQETMTKYKCDQGDGGYTYEITYSLEQNYGEVKVFDVDGVQLSSSIATAGLSQERIDNEEEDEPMIGVLGEIAAGSDKRPLFMVVDTGPVYFGVVAVYYDPVTQNDGDILYCKKAQ